MIRLCLLLLALFPGLAHAGAWPRAEGETFLSFKIGEQAGIAMQSVFVEYGMTPRLTLGAIADRFGGWDGAASVFWRTALLPEGPLQISLTTSIGTATENAPPTAAGVARNAATGITLNAGYGFTAAGRNAWLDGFAGFERGSEGGVVTFGVTAGIALTPRHRVFVETEAEQDLDGNDIAIRIAPHIAYGVSDTLDLTLGYGYAPGDAPDRIDVGAWLAF